MGMHHVNILGARLVYPGHPLVIAYLIARAYPSLEAAERIDPDDAGARYMAARRVAHLRRNQQGWG